MTFSYEDAEKLKKECAKSLRKAGHKAPNTNERKRIRKRFNSPDESKIRSINKPTNYTKWLEAHDVVQEPIEANPDLWEDDLSNTVDD